MSKRKLPNKKRAKKQKIDENEESKQVYKLNVSLQRLSLASIAVQLWMHDDIQQAVARDLHAMRPEMDKVNALKQIERQVFTSASTLAVTEDICEMLLDPIKHVGLEMYNWITFQDQLFGDLNYEQEDLVSVDYLDNVVWTPMGQVDYKKTARSVLSRGHFTSVIRFKFACHYCLEEEMKHSWNDVKSYSFCEDKRIVRFWVAKFTGKSVRISVRDTFYDALLNRNETAARFLWDQFGKSIHCAVRDVYQLTQWHNANFMCFVLSQANYEEQQKIFRSWCYRIIRRLLFDCLWGDHFLPTLLQMKKFMKTEEYWCLLNLIRYRLVTSPENYKCIKYKCILREVWECSPKKDMFRNNRVLFTECLDVVCGLFQRNCMDIVELILSDADSQNRKAILLTRRATDLCWSFLINRDWDLLEIFIQYACDSLEDINNLITILNAETDILSYLTRYEWYRVKQFFRTTVKRQC